MIPHFPFLSFWNVSCTHSTHLSILEEHEPHLEGLAVRPDVSRRPVGEALDMQGFFVVETAFLQGLGPVMEETVHLQQLSGWQRHLNTNPT